MVTGVKEFHFFLWDRLTVLCTCEYMVTSDDFVSYFCENFFEDIIFQHRF